MSTTIEQRAGRITESEYRAVVEVAGKVATGAWQFTKRTAQADAKGLRASLLPSAEESARIMVTESRRRCELALVRIVTDRRVLGGAA